MGGLLYVAGLSISLSVHMKVGKKHLKTSNNKPFAKPNNYDLLENQIKRDYYFPLGASEGSCNRNKKGGSI